MPQLLTLTTDFDICQIVETPSKNVWDNAALSRVLKLHSSTNGVDKILRTLQFVARLVAFQLNFKSSHGLVALRKQLSLSRRCMKLANTVENFKNLLRAPQEKQDWILKALTVLKCAGNFAHASTDSILYFHDARACNLSKGLKRKLDKYANIFWGTALLATAFSGIYKMIDINQALLRIQQDRDERLRLSKQPPLRETSEFQFIDAPPTPPLSPVDQPFDANNEEQKRLEKQRRELALGVLGAGSDALFPAAALDIAGFGWVTEGVLSVAGCISSAVGLRSVWLASA